VLRDIYGYKQRVENGSLYIVRSSYMTGDKPNWLDAIVKAICMYEVAQMFELRMNDGMDALRSSWMPDSELRMAGWMQSEL
jgi:hypothetical protein